MPVISQWNLYRNSSVGDTEYAMLSIEWNTEADPPVPLNTNVFDSNSQKIVAAENKMLPTVEMLGWSNSGYVFSEWNTQSDGTGTGFNTGEYPPISWSGAFNLYAIWQLPPPTKYLTNSTDLTNIANAIRTKGGTSASLAYPSGFVSAINAIPAGGGSNQTLVDVISREIVSIEDSYVTKVGINAFLGCQSLITVSFPNCTEISYSAFQNCTNLYSINASKCNQIRDGAFSACSHLTSAYFPSCLALGSNAFRGCVSLANVTMPSINTIPIQGFYGCNLLSEANFPEVIVIYSSAFYRCINLTSVSFNKCGIVSAYAFQQCGNLTELQFPHCSTVYGSAFIECSNLSTIYLPECSIFYGGNTFAQCRKLLSVYLLASVVASIGYSTIFSSTPISNYTTYTSGVYGSIFVRASLLSSWKTTSYWTLFSDRFVGLTDEQIAALSF